MTAEATERLALTIPATVVAILSRLESAGFETWCVGGAIRDALMGHPQTDVDLATAATPEQVRQLFRRTVPVGLEHGTVGVLDDIGALHEVTTFRRDVRTDGRHAVVEFGASFDEDLARRDFTINAIAWHPLRRVFHDPFGGHDDIRRGLVRAVGDPAARFREDRLRILRALRFAARFDFRIDPATWAAALAQAAATESLSAERVREEWWKGVERIAEPARLAELWQRAGIADRWLAADRVTARSSLPGDPVLALAAWRRPVAPILRRLKCSNSDIQRGVMIDRGPAAPAGDSGREVRRWLAAVGAAADDLIRLAECESGVAPAWAAVVADVRRRGDATARQQLAVSGDDLVAAGIVRPGPALGRLLARLLDAVIEDPALNERDVLLDLAGADD